ncbi:MAG TPA: hypothetical protein VL401_00040 [Alphaproteobacteria bacterium]|jgi:hypothetical protein|nr:hypothetical protein [Alphaproteobacteria bacterium]
MSNFNVDSDFNIFDEWGNFQGKFVPEGGGMNGCLGIIALIIAGVLIFGIYIVIRSLFEGFKSLSPIQRIFVMLGTGLTLTILCSVFGLSLLVRNYQSELLEQKRETQLANSTQVSIIKTATAYALATEIENAHIIATATFAAARINLVKFEGVKLLTFGDVQPNRCGDLQPCNKQAFIQFTVTNNMDSEIYLVINGPCGQPGKIDPYYGPQAVFIDGSLDAGKSGTMICDYGNDPSEYMIEVTQPTCWKIYPYVGKIEDCQ